MTKPGVIYELTWNTVKDNGSERVILVKIFDNSIQIDSVTGEEIIYQVDPAESDPLRISNVDNDEDKFTPLRAKKATIKFLNSDAVNYSTFSSGEDDRFEVEIDCDSVAIFRGFLHMSAISEPFLTQFNQVVTLTAIDGLAYLKNIPLTDFDGTIPNGKNTIITYIAWCLWKTGLDININVINNLRERDNPRAWQTGPGDVVFVAPNTINIPLGFTFFYKVGDTINISGSTSNNGNKVIATNVGSVLTVTGSVVNETASTTITWTDSNFGHIYTTCYLDAKTFENTIGTTIDCYSALERILGHDCFLTQYLGNWWIMRVKEMRNDFVQYYVQYDNQGGISSEGTNNYEKAVGLKDVLGTSFPGTPDSTSFFSQAKTSRQLQRPTGSVKLTYRFDLPAEIVCNIDYSRGDYIADLPDEVDADGLTVQVKKYNLDCWTLLRGAGATSTTTDATAYIKRLFSNGHEKERMILITYPSTHNPKSYIESEPIDVGTKDKFNFSFDWATEVDENGSPTLNEPVASIWLEADDGSFWKLSQDNGNGYPEWLTTNSADEYGLNTVLIIPIDFVQSTNDWVSKSIKAPPIPIGGKLRIRFLASNTFTTTDDDFNVKIQNIVFEYFPFIDGGYVKFTGQSNKTTRPGNYKSKIEDQVYISNSPRKIFKGALFKKTINGIYAVVDRFYEGQQFLYANDGVNNLFTYGELQVRSVHNQYRNPNEMISFTLQGLNGFSEADLIHRIFNRDIEPSTNQQAFQIVWMDQNWRNSEWTGVMIKNFDNNIGFVLDDFEFKYEQ